MTRRTRIRVLAPIALGALLLMGALLAKAPSDLVRPSRRPAVPSSPRPAVPSSHPPVITSDSLTRLVDQDPFRLSRQPAPVRYDPLTRASGDQPAPPPPRPVFVVSGILWGRVPSALVEGFPGTEGPRLVRAGDQVGVFRLLRINRTVVVIRGADTTWTLTIREPWQ